MEKRDRRGFLVGTNTATGSSTLSPTPKPVSTLAELIKQDRFASPAQEAMLNVLVTYPWIMGELAAAMGAHDLTPAQYNVLRILRGAHPERVPCSYIGERLLDRTPDVTRLLDRLQRAGLIERQRAEHDRRVVEVAITDVGLERLRELQRPVEEAVHSVMGGLSEEEQRQLSALLERLRTRAEAPVAVEA
jgi:DNA-binding MarR family transcriptional regulator